MIVLFRYQIFTINFLVYTWKCQIGFRYVNTNKLKIIKSFTSIHNFHHTPPSPSSLMKIYLSKVHLTMEHFNLNMYINVYDRNWICVQWYTRLKRLNWKKSVLWSIENLYTWSLFIQYSTFYKGHWLGSVCTDNIKHALEYTYGLTFKFNVSANKFTQEFYTLPNIKNLM